MIKLFFKSFLISCSLVILAGFFVYNKKMPSVSKFDEAKIVTNNGDTLTVGEYRDGKAMLLNIWSTGCGACLLENPSLDKAYQELKTHEIKVIALSSDELDKQINYLRKNQFGFPVAEAIDKNMLDGIALPTTYLLNSDGESIEIMIGSRQWDKEDFLASLIEKFSE